MQFVNQSKPVDTKALNADLLAVFRKHGIDASNIDAALDGLSANTAGHAANGFLLPDGDDFEAPDDDAPRAHNAQDSGFQLPE